MDLGSGKTQDYLLCIFISPYELQFLFVVQFFCSKSICFESFRWNIIHKNFLWVFLLGFSNFKMTSATLNTSFHIDLGMFIGD